MPEHLTSAAAPAPSDPAVPAARPVPGGAGPVVGFDLDMTLIDSRPGIGAAYRVLAAETGVPIDVDLVVSRLGPPLETELACWFPAEQVPAAAARYREVYPTTAIAPSLALPGAAAALEAVRAHGGRSLVVTAKNEEHARLHLDHLGLRADLVVGSLWAEAKGVRCAHRGPPSTSGTTSATCAVPGPPGPSPWPSPPGAAPPTNSAPPAPTSSSRT